MPTSTERAHDGQLTLDILAAVLREHWADVADTAGMPFDYVTRVVMEQIDADAVAAAQRCPQLSADLYALVRDELVRQLRVLGILEMARAETSAPPSELRPGEEVQLESDRVVSAMGNRTVIGGVA